MTKFLKSLLLFAATALLVTSCEKDEVTPTIALSQRAIILSSLGESATISYDGANIDNISNNSVPTGWGLAINTSNRTIVVTAPTSESDFDKSAENTTVTITVNSVDDRTATAFLTLGTTDNYTDLSSVQSNSYIVSQAHRVYSFKANLKGESNETFAPASAKLIWQTANKPISMVRLDGDMVKFYVANDEDDINENGATSDIIEGNALIGAFDSNGQALWSWHIWISDYTPEANLITLNSEKIMDRNLGASDNANSTNDEILSSYGMYYQWGRKEPFPAPAQYNAAYSTDAKLYNEFGYSVLIKYEASSAAVGTSTYATMYPSTFITGVEESGYDWQYSDHSSSLWSDEKSINDPCPRGYRITSEDVYANLTLPSLSDSDVADLANSYGWELSDGATSELFMGLGRRGQITGRIQNVNTNEERPAPWIGYYWSCAATNDNKSNALYFAYDATSAEDCTIETSKASYRATGMQVRCQKIE